MLTEFKQFAAKGNVVDMAVGIILGAAFTAIVKSFVDDIMMPPLGMLMGNIDFSNYYFLLRDGTPEAPYDTLDAAKSAGAVVIAYGRMVNTAISFLITAFALFLLVRWVNRLRAPDTPPAPSTKPCPYCTLVIHEKATRCPNCTSEVA